LTDQPNHIALFGGTFNPIHRGHLVAAKESATLCGIDRIYFIPSFIPPHRELEGKTPAKQRLEMVRLACAGSDLFEASDVEIARGQTSYSYDTIQWFITRNSPETRISFLIGTDAFALIDTWRRAAELFSLCDFLVMMRPGAQMSLTDALPASLRASFVEMSNDKLRHQSGHQVHAVPIRGLEIASKQVRKRLASNQPIDDLVPEAVADYIRRNGLYRAN
jgi:nicotinate-nucleotide adenylyltransferase